MPCVCNSHLSPLSLLLIFYLFFYSSSSFRHAPYSETPETCCGFPIEYKNISLLSPHGRLPNTFVNISGWFFPHPPLVPACGKLSHLCDIYNKSNNNATIVVIHGHGCSIHSIFSLLPSTSLYSFVLIVTIHGIHR